MKEQIIEEVLEWFEQNKYENCPFELSADISEAMNLALQKQEDKILEIIDELYKDYLSKNIHFKNPEFLEFLEELKQKIKPEK